MQNPNSPADDVVTRPIALRRRTDLVATRQRIGGHAAWVIKDPVALRYVQLGEEEYTILTLLDGQLSLQALRATFEKRFAPLRLSYARLQSFLGNLHREGLVLSDAAGQGQRLWERFRERRRGEWLSRTANPLVIRFRGIDPEALLNQLYPLVRWIFAPWCLALACAAILGAGTLVLTQYRTLQARLPDFYEIFVPGNLLWLAVALGMSKILHELGHALTCKHLGGECHELGIMLLVFTPCLYCDVSDTWMVASKWRRIAVSAAGIFVEVSLAALCTYLWWFSQPGRLNTICLNTMLVCSLNTLLVNGNPLLRYDGYFILADLVETPNLWNQSRAAIRRWATRVVLGRRGRDATMPVAESPRLLVYGVLSSVYRTIALLAIGYVFWRICRHNHLEAVGAGMLVAVVSMIFIAPLVAAAGHLASPTERNRWLRGRPLAIMALCTLLFMATVLVPLPHRVHALVMVEADGERPVFVTEPGRILSAIPEGTHVKTGEVLARLESPAVQRELVRFTGEREQKRLRLESLKSLRLQDPAIGGEIPEAEKALAAAAERLRQEQLRAERLVVVSPVDGMVFAPRQVDRGSEPGKQPVGPWVGTPLDPENTSGYLPAGSLLCTVGHAQRRQALVFVREDDIPDVNVGASVWISLAQSPGRVWDGLVRDVAEINLESLPPELAGNPFFAARRDARDVNRPLDAVYQVRVELDEPDAPLLVRASGKAKIAASPISVVTRIGRYLRRTFAFVN